MYSKIFKRRPVEFMRQRRMRGDVERRHADVGGGKNRRNVFVRHGSDECNAVEAGRCLALRAAAQGRRR